MNLRERHDWLLQQLGITQWQLKHPVALKGSMYTTLPASVRLVLLADHQPALSNPLLQDILRALQLTEDQVYCLSADQQVVLPVDCICWSLGQLPLSYHRSIIISSSLEQLQRSAEAKRQLWKQICHYAYHVSTKFSTNL